MRTNSYRSVWGLMFGFRVKFKMMYSVDVCPHSCRKITVCVLMCVLMCVTGSCSRWVAFPTSRRRGGSFLFMNESFVCVCLCVFQWTDTCCQSVSSSSETLSTCCVQASPKYWTLWHKNKSLWFWDGYVQCFHPTCSLLTMRQFPVFS